MRLRGVGEGTGRRLALRSGMPRRLPFPGFGPVVKSAVARGLIPFDWAAAPSYRRIRRQWPGGVPRTFTQKLQYKIMTDRRRIARTYADKLEVRSYVQTKCPTLRLSRVLAIVAAESELNVGVPAAPWVMKATHGSGMVLICDRAGAVSPDEIRERAGRWLRTDYALRYWEWQYARLPRRVVFEEYLGDERGAPDDYKFYVVHQQVRFIVVDHDRFGQHTRSCFWPDWTPIGSRIGRYPPPATPPARPAALEQMLAVAEQLACDTDMVRIDLYCVRGEVYFGEITHSPSAGGLVFSDPALDRQLGEGWTLPARYVDAPAPPPDTREASPSGRGRGVAPTVNV